MSHINVHYDDDDDDDDDDGDDDDDRTMVLCAIHYGSVCTSVLVTDDIWRITCATCSSLYGSQHTACATCSSMQ